MEYTKRVIEARERGDHEVTDEETEAARNAEIARAGKVYNGCTDAGLRRIHGDKLYHIMGHGWFVRK
jgi:hypothetical protein